VVECAFVENDLTSAASFFATQVKLGPASAKEVLPFGPLRCPPSSWRGWTCLCPTSSCRLRRRESSSLTEGRNQSGRAEWTLIDRLLERVVR
jgi:hypothetical protein